MSSTETDIRIRVGFFRHFKTRKLKRMLDAESVLCLQALWAWAAENRTTGDLGGMADDDIALSADWEGDTSVFISALVACGWLDKTERGYQLHDYEIEQPYIQKRALRIENGRKGAEKANENMTPEQRSERGKKGAAARWSDDECLEDAKYPLDKCLVDARYTEHGCLVNTKSMLAPSLPLPNPSCPDLPLPDQLLEREGSEVDSSRKPAGLPTTSSDSEGNSNETSNPVQPDLPQCGTGKVDIPKEPKKRGRPKQERPERLELAAQKTELFDFWKSVMGKRTKTILEKGDLRDRRLNWALTRYSFDEIRLAIIGCAATPHNMGKGDTTTKYNDLSLILRDEVHVERFIESGEVAKTSIDSETGKVHVSTNDKKVMDTLDEQHNRLMDVLNDHENQYEPQYAECQFPTIERTGT